MMLAGVKAVGSGSVGRCGLSTCQVTLSRHAFRKMLMPENKKNKRKWYMHEGLLRLDSMAVAGAEEEIGKTKVSKNLPRLRALNKVYLEKISDILSTGAFANQLYGRGLELSEVRFHPDLKGVNVYWVASGEPQKDRETEELLNSHVREIRHQLSTLRLLGSSPPITFVRDQRHCKLQEVERLLAMADYGDDFEPTDPTHHLRTSTITSSTRPLHPSLKAAIEDFNIQTDAEERVEVEQLDPFEEALRIASTWPQQKPGAVTAAAADDATVTLPKDLPTMRDDVLGVNTSKIYKMIEQNMIRARADHRRQLRDDKEAREDSDIAFSPTNQPHRPHIVNRSRDIHQWANRYKQMQGKKAKIKNKEMAMLSVSSAWQGNDNDEEEEMEVHWVEEEEEEEFQ